MKLFQRRTANRVVPVDAEPAEESRAAAPLQTPRPTRFLSFARFHRRGASRVVPVEADATTGRRTAWTPEESTPAAPSARPSTATLRAAGDSPSVVRRPQRTNRGDRCWPCRRRQSDRPAQVEDVPAARAPDDARLAPPFHPAEARRVARDAIVHARALPAPAPAAPAALAPDNRRVFLGLVQLASKKPMTWEGQIFLRIVWGIFFAVLVDNEEKIQFRQDGI